jgi:uncharacterized membrane protein YkvA (DUF1232 family)
MASPKRFAAVAAVYHAVRLAVRPGGPSLGERAGAMPRLVRAAVTGEYTGITKGRLALMAAAVAYIVSPIDLIPEFVLLAGLADDALVMSWLATQFVEETEAFLAWELAQVAPAYAATSGYSAPSDTSDTSYDRRYDTVRGNVVP